MIDFEQSKVDIINKNYLCDRCGRSKKCKDYSGINSGKKYHHIYCEKYIERKDEDG